MTKYSDDTWAPSTEEAGYRDGVDAVLEYIESTYSYPKLLAELKWAIDEGIL